MDINQAKEKFIVKTRVEIGDEDYVVVREPTESEIKGFGDDSQKNLEIIAEILPECILEHSFTVDGKPAKNKEVAELVRSSVSLYTRFVKQWMNDFVIDDKKKVN